MTEFRDVNVQFYQAPPHGQTFWAEWQYRSFGGGRDNKNFYKDETKSGLEPVILEALRL
jgi:hypothetical protein